MARKIVKVLLLALSFGVFLYVTVYLLAARGEAFKFVEPIIRNSPTIALQVGEVKRIELDPWGPYTSKTAGADEWVTMALQVTGSNGSVVLHVSVRKANETWKIEHASIDGQPYQLVINGS